MRPASSGTIPIIRGAVYCEEHRSLPVCTLCVDRRSKLDESLDQTQLPGDHAPMKSDIAKCIACLRQVRLPPQDRANLARIPGDDRFFEHIEIGRVVKLL